MNKKLYSILIYVLLIFGTNGASATIIDLNAQIHTQASAANPVNIHLTAGTYSVTAVGIAGGGVYDAWSAWSNNLNCLPDHTCERGWETSFDYFFSDGYFLAQSVIRYDTAAEALAHPQSAMFTLTSAETVSFGFNECAGCLGDNRGGVSLLIANVPEPTTIFLFMAGLFAMSGRRLHQSLTFRST
jgi:hypothetical protein